MRVLLLHNATAGEDDWGDEIVGLIEDAGHKIRHASKKSEIQKALDKPTDLVVVAGGDGTVPSAAKQLIGRKTPLTILPIGTANNIAHSLGIVAEPKALIAGWADGTILPFDAAVAVHPRGRKVFFESAGLGLFTEAMCQAKAHSDSGEKFSADERFDRDFRFLRRLAGDFPAIPCTVEVDGRSSEAEVLLCEIMNSRQIGSRLVLAPNANPGDGVLDLVLVTEQDRSLLKDFLQREPSDDTLPHLPVYQGKRFRITSRVRRIHVADKIKRLQPSGTPWVLDVQIQPGAIQVLVPRVM
jgi:diacylglycerol kinase (ATP)